MNNRFLRLLPLLALVAFAALSGCRREEPRDITLEIPELTEAMRPKIVDALKKYGGIDKSSYRWDYLKHTLTLRYDRMQLAEANIRYALDEAGFRVVFPANTSGYAGALNERVK